MSETKTYIAIDLKSFYASVECIERGLDPMTTNLVVADADRTEKTICLAVSPALKSYGIPGRPRLFEVVQKVAQVNAARKLAAGRLRGKSHDASALKTDLTLAVDYIIASPRMAYYMEYSTRIYRIYLQHVAPEDIHVYSIDEVMIDATAYLRRSGCTPYEFTRMLLRDVVTQTGITATAGIGTNLYLAKVAMDIEAKHIQPDADGARVAQLDEMSYRRRLWEHRPLTDFWRVGPGYAKKLEEHGLYTMGDVARCSIGAATDYYNEELLYKLFGINAELLIDHAWGWEPCTIADIKAYRPESNSLCSGQVLQYPYSYEKAKLVVREMTDLMVLDLVDKGLVTDQIVLTIGYDVENLQGGKSSYRGAVTIDRYGRKIPKHAHGSTTLARPTSSSKQIIEATMALYDRIVSCDLTVRRITVTANRVVSEGEARKVEDERPEQMSLFVDYEEKAREQEAENDALRREKQMQKAVISIKKKYGKNAIFKGMNLQEGATAKDRNRQIGGHKA